MGIILFGGFLAGNAWADGSAAPSSLPGRGERQTPQVVGAFCDSPACAAVRGGGLGHASGFAAAALAALWMSRRRG